MTKQTNFSVPNKSTPWVEPDLSPTYNLYKFVVRLLLKVKRLEEKVEDLQR